jgi:hypothetical protein
VVTAELRPVALTPRLGPVDGLLDRLEFLRAAVLRQRRRDPVALVVLVPSGPARPPSTPAQPWSRARVHLFHFHRSSGVSRSGLSLDGEEP